MIMGLPGAGKTSTVNSYVESGFERLNRDELGGGMDHILQLLEKRYNAGVDKFVLDNTFVDKASRAPFIVFAKKHGFEIVAIWIDISKEDALHNVATRIVRSCDKKGDSYFAYKVLSADKNNKHIDGHIPAIAVHAKAKIAVQPTLDEGFNKVDVLPFKRHYGNCGSNKAAIFDYDGTLRETISGSIYPKSVDDIRILPGRIEKLNKLKSDGYILLGVSNQSGVAKGDLTFEDATACFKRTNELLGINIDFVFCPHGSFPATCYCRKPCSGFGAYFIEKYKLDPRKCFFVGDMTTDKSFARRSGFDYHDQKDFFG